MTAKSELQIVEKKVISLPTQARRAVFARKEMRTQGLSVQALADKSGRHWMTVARFLDLNENLGPSMNPATETTKSIFMALGYSLCFVKTGSKGVVEL